MRCIPLLDTASDMGRDVELLVVGWRSGSGASMCKTSKIVPAFSPTYIFFVALQGPSNLQCQSGGKNNETDSLKILALLVSWLITSEDDRVNIFNSYSWISQLHWQRTSMLCTVRLKNICLDLRQFINYLSGTAMRELLAAGQHT